MSPFLFPFSVLIIASPEFQLRRSLFSIFSAQMPSLSFIYTDTDLYRLIDHILTCGGSFIEDRDYNDPCADAVDDKSLVVEMARKGGHSFIINKSGQSSPLKFHKNTIGNKWRLMQRTGGPYMDLLWSLPQEYEGCLYIPHGLVGLFDTYRNTYTNEYEAPNKILQYMYRDTTTFIKQDGFRLSSSQTYWIGPDAISAIKRGARIGVAGLERFAP